MENEKQLIKRHRRREIRSAAISRGKRIIAIIPVLFALLLSSFTMTTIGAIKDSVTKGVMGDEYKSGSAAGDKKNGTQPLFTPSEKEEIVDVDLLEEWKNAAEPVHEISENKSGGVAATPTATPQPGYNSTTNSGYYTGTQPVNPVVAQSYYPVITQTRTPVVATPEVPAVVAPSVKSQVTIESGVQTTEAPVQPAPVVVPGGVPDLYEGEADPLD